MRIGMTARGWSLAKQLVVLQICLVIVIVGVEAVAVLYRPLNGLTERSHGLLALLALTEVALALGVAGSLLIADHVRRQTFGLEPAEIARQYQQHDAILHAIGDGLLIIDSAGTLTLANDEARRLLNFPQDCEGQHISDVLEGSGVVDLLTRDRAVDNELYGAAGRVLLINRRHVSVGDRPVGTVTILRDRTELQTALRELDTVRTLLDALRTQAHESANRMQTLIGLVELGRYDDAIAMGARAAEIGEHDSDRLLQRIADASVVALILGKAAEAAERGVQMRVSEESTMQGGLFSTDLLMTIIGNLLDNAIDATSPVNGTVRLSLVSEADGGLSICVQDDGPGIAADNVDDIFQPGWTTKVAATPAGRGHGLTLVQQAVTQLNGTIEVVAEGGARFEVRLPLPPGLPSAAGQS